MYVVINFNSITRYLMNRVRFHQQSFPPLKNATMTYHYTSFQNKTMSPDKLLYNYTIGNNVVCLLKENVYVYESKKLYVSFVNLNKSVNYYWEQVVTNCMTWVSPPDNFHINYPYWMSTLYRTTKLFRIPQTISTTRTFHFPNKLSPPFRGSNWFLWAPGGDRSRIPGPSRFPIRPM